MGESMTVERVIARSRLDVDTCGMHDGWTVLRDDIRRLDAAARREARAAALAEAEAAVAAEVELLRGIPALTHDGPLYNGLVSAERVLAAIRALREDTHAR